jgi:hypothetical protein
LVVRRFEESSDGSLERFDDDLGEEDIGMLKSRIAALETDIQMLKSGNLAGHEKSFINQLLSAKDAAGGAIPQGTSPGKQTLEQNLRDQVLTSNRWEYWYRPWRCSNGDYHDSFGTISRRPA